MFVGETPRDLTLDDALALLRSPGRAAHRAAGRRRGRAVGRRAAAARCRCSAPPPSCCEVRQHARWRRASSCRAGDLEPRPPVCVIGAKVRASCSGTRRRSASSVRIGDRRFRVIGVLGHAGQLARHEHRRAGHRAGGAGAGAVQHRSLFRILVEARSRDAHRAGQGARSTQIIQAAPRGRGGRHGHHPGRGARHLRPHPARADADAWPASPRSAWRWPAS